MGRAKVRGDGCISGLILLLFWIIAKVVEVTIDYLEDKPYSTIRNFNTFLFIALIGIVCACIWLMYLIGGINTEIQF